MVQKTKTKEKKEVKIHKDLTIGDVAMSYPEAIEVLMSEGVHCVGCGAAYHETIEEGLTVHGKSKKEISDIVKRMNEAIEGVKSNPDSITVTKKASAKIKEIIKKEKKTGYGLRIEVTTGGCAGHQYSLDFDKKEKKGDHVIKSEGVKIFVDNESFALIKGSRVDYIDSLQGAGFKITNPNIESTCGCGDSF
ncbi:iron-sulfur cluster assembly accessory protein [Bacteroidota bacterium]